jgi:hypothetical protein
MESRRIGLVSLIVLMLWALTACAPGGGLNGRKLNCSAGGEVCLNLSTVQTFKTGEAVPLKITVTSTKDITDLHVSLSYNSEIQMDGPQTWENNLLYPTLDQGFAYWNFPIKAGQTLTFNRVLHFPLREGYFDVLVEVNNIGRIIHAFEAFYVVLVNAGGLVSMSGTPIPHIITPHGNISVYGPGTPVPSPITNPTYGPPPATTGPTPALKPAIPTLTPPGSPYPPPIRPASSPYP